MRLEKRYKPSFHKANAPYRGVTSLNQYSNFVLESAHDILQLSHILTGNEKKGVTGHQKDVEKNFMSIMTGDEEVGRTNLFTSSTLRKIDKERALYTPPVLSWSKLNGCVVTDTGDGYELSSEGLLDPVGIYKNIYVQPGDFIYMRLKAKSVSGAESFSFGSNNKREGANKVGDTKQVTLVAGEGFKVFDYIIACKYAQTISLSINVHEKPNTLTPTKVIVKDVEVFYMQEKPVRISSFEKDIKPAINTIEERINSMR